MPGKHSIDEFRKAGPTVQKFLCNELSRFLEEKMLLELPGLTIEDHFRDEFVEKWIHVLEAWGHNLCRWDLGWDDEVWGYQSREKTGYGLIVVFDFDAKIIEVFWCEEGCPFPYGWPDK